MNTALRPGKADSETDSKDSSFTNEKEWQHSMKLWIVRHGEPDGRIDRLTEKGKREAELTALRMEKNSPDYIYVSPLTRARDTAAPTLKALGREEVVKDWLREFSWPVVRDDGTQGRQPWDNKPAQWTAHPENFTEDAWTTTSLALSGDLASKYREVTEAFDELLAQHGYVREGRIYRAVRPNTDTIALFCHFGLTCVLLSHLLNLPVMPLWHGLVAPPASVTTIATEEREEGIAYFRMSTLGDVSHLTEKGEPASFHARFCEVYSDFTQRHD